MHTTMYNYADIISSKYLIRQAEYHFVYLVPFILCVKYCQLKCHHAPIRSCVGLIYCESACQRRKPRFRSVSPYAPIVLGERAGPTFMSEVVCKVDTCISDR